jgi:6-phosphogluconate dehydrogenase
MAAIDEGVQATVLSAALYQRFVSRGADHFACRVVQGMRRKFGGHQEGEDPKKATARAAGG